MSRLEDLETTMRIKLALLGNPGIGGMEIKVEAINGIIFLRGAVQDLQQRGLAEAIARANGAIDVKNELLVFSEELPESGLSGSEEDMYLESRVLGDLESDGRVNSVTIAVQVDGGVVRLSGWQDDSDGRERAAEIAGRAQGVKEVVNEIKVRKAA
ncbi:MAG: BON domain-containing protein [Armatimonadota bacterium]